ncbi:MAG: hypothetical protein ACAI43_25295 [Phycisphaerae bacterium]|nr:hypothetical protein [Tepidisphaeraceae bacterium]
MGKLTDNKTGAKRRPTRAKAKGASARTTKAARLAELRKRLTNRPKPKKTIEELAREQGKKPLRSIDDLPSIFESEAEADAFFEWSMAERRAGREAARRALLPVDGKSGKK